MIRILLVDDHGLVRTGLRRILEQAGGIEVVGEAEDGASALRLAKQTRPDVVLMDLSMPAGMGGIEATRRLVRLVPGVRVIALTVMDEDPFPDRLREVGALGYLTKGCPAAELVDAVRSVARGGLTSNRRWPRSACWPIGPARQSPRSLPCRRVRCRWR